MSSGVIETGTARRLVLAALATLSLLVTALLASAPALAAAPETPELTVGSITATNATFHGVLSPKATQPTEGGTYKFLYKASKTECKGGSETTQGLSMGVAHEEVGEPVGGLSPSTEYTVCLSITNLKSETTLSAPVTFTTLSTIESESVSGVNASEAHLQGVVNPNDQLTECHFQYGATKASENTLPCEPELLKGSGGQGVGATVTGLQPKTPYHYRIVTKNGTGEETTGTEAEFTTTIAPEAPEDRPATAITASTATLHGVLNPNDNGSAGSYEFLYRQSATECRGERTTPTTSAPLGLQGEAEEAPVTGLAPTTQYTFCLLARNEAGETAVGPPETFTTGAAAPTIGVEFPSAVGSTVATLYAQINPGGAPTTYYFEYGTSEPYAKSQEVAVAAAPNTVFVNRELSQLQPGALYHFRVVVRNALGSAVGPDETFTTTAAAPVGSGLGASSCPNASFSGFSSTLPDCRAYELVSTLENTEVSVIPLNQYVSNAPYEVSYGEDKGNPGGYRAAADGEALAYVGGAQPTGVGKKGVAKDENGVRYLAARGADGWGVAEVQPTVKQVAMTFSADLSVQGFATAEAEFIAEQGGPAKCGVYARTGGIGASVYHPLNTTAGGPCGGEIEGISADDSHILLSSGNLYDSVDGQLHQVNILPGGEPEPSPSATFGSTSNLANAVSADGSRVFWTSLESGHEALYVRENDTQPQSPVAAGGCTVPADACTVLISQGARYWEATSDGSEVFYTKGGDLYEFDVETDQSTDLAPGGEVQSVVGSSEPESYDGSYVYFIAAGVLTHGPNAQGREPVAGQSNLYLYHDGVTTFIATETGGPLEMAASGHAVGFGSGLPLAGPGSGGGIFVYQAGTGRIFCATCGPVANNGYVSWSSSPAFVTRWINAEGTEVFFNSEAALVPRDTNGLSDVYEWESDGSGACQQSDGCVSLLSGGDDPDRAFFVDASANGSDAFFTTREDLIPRALDETVKLYDVRAGGGFSEPSLACTGTGCQGLPPAPPIFATPSSVTFAGVGNFEPSPPPAVKPKPKPAKRAKCRRGFVKKHNKCVKIKSKKAKRSSATRRGK
jgi:hypothetical protein